MQTEDAKRCCRGLGTVRSEGCFGAHVEQRVTDVLYHHVCQLSLLPGAAVHLPHSEFKARLSGRARQRTQWCTAGSGVRAALRFAPRAQADLERQDHRELRRHKGARGDRDGYRCKLLDGAKRVAAVARGVEHASLDSTDVCDSADKGSSASGILRHNGKMAITGTVPTILPAQGFEHRSIGCTRAKAPRLESQGGTIST
jgi:hypothetical protein